MLLIEAELSTFCVLIQARTYSVQRALALLNEAMCSSQRVQRASLHSLLRRRYEVLSVLPTGLNTGYRDI